LPFIEYDYRKKKIFTFWFSWWVYLLFCFYRREWLCNMIISKRYKKKTRKLIRYVMRNEWEINGLMKICKTSKALATCCRIITSNDNLIIILFLHEIKSVLDLCYSIWFPFLLEIYWNYRNAGNRWFLTELGSRDLLFQLREVKNVIVLCIHLAYTQHIPDKSNERERKISLFLTIQFAKSRTNRCVDRRVYNRFYYKMSSGRSRRYSCIRKIV